jgi:hypothetical protein
MQNGFQKPCCITVLEFALVLINNLRRAHSTSTVIIATQLRGTLAHCICKTIIISNSLMPLNYIL